MLKELPTILQREPLIEAIFEVRFDATVALADILPGFLFHELEPKPIISRLPAAEVPLPLRANNPAFEYAPTQRLELEKYFILVGDKNVIISCKLPYPKWPKFKEFIVDIMKRIGKVGIAASIERYSLKYVNLIKAPSLAEQLSKINQSIQLGDIHVTDEQMSLQVHRRDNDLLHILTVFIGAEGTMLDGTKESGAVVDIDSIRLVTKSDFQAFLVDLKQNLEALRQANKAKFFGCLTDAAIDEMGPIYGKRS